MATATTISNDECRTCDSKTEVVCLCEGYSQNILRTDLLNYHQTIEEIVQECHVFQQKINKQKNDIHVHPLVQQVDQWEIDSMEKIKQTAAKCRQRLIEQIEHATIETEKKLNKFIAQVTQIRQDNELNENYRNELRTFLSDLDKEFREQRNISIVNEYSLYINEISVPAMPNIPQYATWTKNGATVAGGNGKGTDTNQFNRPHGLFVDDDETVFVADYMNHRVMQWKKSDTNGQVLAGNNGQGNRLDQLDRPTDVLIDKETYDLIICDRGNRRVVRWYRFSGKTQGDILIDNIDCVGLAMDNQRYLYVSDDKKNEVRRYRIGDKHGFLVAGGNGRGSNMTQLNEPRYLFVDQQQNVYVSDSENHRVVKWNKDAKQGILIAGGRGRGNALGQFYWPQGLFVDTLGTVYVVDYGNNRVMRWTQNAMQGSVVVGKEHWGAKANQFNSPMGLSWDQHSNIYVVDEYNHRIQRFSIKDTDQHVSKCFSFSFSRSN